MKYESEPWTMPYAFTQDVPIDRDMYDKIMANLGSESLAGLIVHLVVERPGGLRYIDVWESEEACGRAFEERIHPAVYRAFKEVGVQPAGEPETEHLVCVDLVVPSLLAMSGRTAAMKKGVDA
jgi:hypothetical protein